MTLIRILLPLLCGSFLLASSGSSLYTKKCKSCHGATGTTKAMGKSKSIKGMPVATIEKAMYDYATGDRKSISVIKRSKKAFIRKYSKEELHAVAQYINSL